MVGSTRNKINKGSMKDERMFNMKKLTVFLLAMALAASTAISTSAVEFTPSVQGKEAPSIVITQNENGEDVGAKIVDVNGKVVKEVKKKQIIITPLAKANDAPVKIKEELTKAYAQIKEVTSLEELVPQISEFLSKASENIKAEDMVVRDLFDVEIDDATRELLKDGNSIEIVFDLGVSADEFVVCLHNIGGDRWEVIDDNKVTNNGNGTVSVQFTSLSPIAFAVQKSGTTVEKTTTMVEEDADAKPNPNTGAGNVTGLAAAVLGCSVVAFAVAKKK